MERTKIMEYVERKRAQRFQCLQKPEQYREPGELERIEETLMTLECLAFECGLIEEMSI